MRAERILDALGSIDDRFIVELYEEPAQTPRRRSRIRAALLAAAILALLTACAVKVVDMAWEDGWFDDFFSEGRTEAAAEQLNGNQEELLDRGLVKVGQSVTCNGYTITLDSALADGYRAFAKFTVEAPEGVVLNGEECYLEISSNVAHPNGTELDYMAATDRNSSIVDDNPQDNRITFLSETLMQVKEDSVQLLEKGTIWKTQITHIWRSVGEDRELVAAGDWCFSYAFEKDTLLREEYEVLDSPIRCSGKRDLWRYRFPVTVKVTSFRIRALSATLRYDKPLSGYWEGIMLDKTYVVLKDGSRVEAHFRMGYNMGDYWEQTLLFSIPIAIEDVDYVEFPGNQRIAVGVHK